MKSFSSHILKITQGAFLFLVLVLPLLSGAQTSPVPPPVTTPSTPTPAAPSGNSVTPPGGNPAAPSPAQSGGNTVVPPGPGGSAQPSTGLSYSLKNPLAFDSIEDLFLAILNIIMVIAVPIIVIFIIFSGFKYVTSQGDTSKVEEAKKALTNAIIGGVLIIGALAIAQIIKGLVTAFAA